MTMYTAEGAIPATELRPIAAAVTVTTGVAIPAVLVAFALVEEVDGGELTLGVLF